jgi:DNA-binding NarL/FixJ family response regulator
VSLIRVLIADDESIIREALRDVLDADPRFEVVGLASSADELRPLAELLRPDIVLVDVRMPGGGEAATRAVLTLPAPDAASVGTRGTPPVVVAVSGHTGVAVVAAMLRAGVSGYLAKGSLGQLPDLVARCANGEVVLAVPRAVDALREVMGDVVDAPTRIGCAQP